MVFVAGGTLKWTRRLVERPILPQEPLLPQEPPSVLMITTKLSKRGTITSSRCVSSSWLLWPLTALLLTSGSEEEAKFPLVLATFPDKKQGKNTGRLLVLF